MTGAECRRANLLAAAVAPRESVCALADPGWVAFRLVPPMTPAIPRNRNTDTRTADINRASASNTEGKAFATPRKPPV
jgi:hypothetical protein